MRIGIVAYELEGAATGVGRYLAGLLAGIAECDCDWQWLLFFRGDPFEHPLWSAPGSGGERRFQPLFDRRERTRPIVWEQLRLPRLLRRAELDFVFSPAYSLPPRLGVPAIVTVHDLSFERLPEEFPWKERWRRRMLARRAARRAVRVLADTREIARELEHTYRLDPGKIGVVPLAVDGALAAGAASSGDGDAALLRSCGIEPPYLLYLGSILARRHVELVIATFSAVAAELPSLRLVLAGSNRLRRPEDLREWIARSGCGERIGEIGYVAEEALVALYRRAELSYYLSSYEGYGLPPLESLAAATPAIVGRGLALDDVWPEYPYRCETLDLDTVVAVTRAALAEPDRRRRIGREGAERVARLTWKRSAELFLAEIARALAA
ncbi:MAG: glycosyltransferase family 4 protein [bacterium]|nr:glycosyltransferase family 4 protein [bacterium]